MSSDLPNYSSNSTLTAEQHHVLALLAEGRSFTAAAAESGVHRNTIRNWRRTVPAFARECEQAIRQQADAWHQRVVDLAPRALEVLDEVLNDPAASPALRLRAALAVLKTATSPHVDPLSVPHILPAQREDAWDRYLARHSDAAETAADPTDNSQVVHVQNENPCTILHNAPIRRAPEPARNTPCPCGSGQKYKRCCASYAPPRTATPLTAAAA